MAGRWSCADLDLLDGLIESAHRQECHTYLKIDTVAAWAHGECPAQFSDGLIVLAGSTIGRSDRDLRVDREGIEFPGAVCDRDGLQELPPPHERIADGRRGLVAVGCRGSRQQLVSFFPAP